VTTSPSTIPRALSRLQSLAFAMVLVASEPQSQIDSTDDERLGLNNGLQSALTIEGHRWDVRRSNAVIVSDPSKHPGVVEQEGHRGNEVSNDRPCEGPHGFAVT
jgi:hypothetical protein